MNPGHRSFFFSNTGKFGIRPQNTEEGDIIVVLDGADVPFVLRQVPFPDEMSISQRLEANFSLEFVGEYFLDGAIDGEIFANPLSSDPLFSEPLDVDPVFDAEGEYAVRRVYRRVFFNIH